MEDRSIIRQKCGIANARKVSAAKVEDSETQSVTVTDGHEEVFLSLQSCGFPAGLTPNQARMLAKQLEDAAERVEGFERR